MKKVNILGTDYTIVYKDLGGPEEDGSIVYGYCDATIKEIAIRDKNLGNVEDFIAYQKQTLRHEVIHAFMSESGLQDSWQHAQQFGHDETTVDWFAIQSPKIYKVFNELDIL